MLADRRAFFLQKSVMKEINMLITVNGNPENIPGPTSLADFLSAKGIHADGVVIELNQDIPEKSAYTEILLHENDKLEILRFVGGG
ncbi:MAG: sulfur carrier protein ThiS [Desulfobacteraceae bacterium]|nr:MAG: sulfur carrier protein ThiS [Desulfobacteraceae bacterium]